MKAMQLVCLILCVLSGPGVAFGQRAQSGVQGYLGIDPAGRWKTLDDKTGEVNSVVVIWEENGTLCGRIEKLVNPDPQDPHPRCTRCDGDLKNKPLVGLRILWGMRKNGNQWTGGEILDPDDGRIYRCLLSVEGGGEKLKVRGYIGFSLLGRTQYWLRDR